MPIHIKRVYEKAERDDGARILVDRLWPRGLSKDSVRMDDWLRDIAPSDSLRKWYGHKPERWPQFRRRYSEELREHAAELDELRDLARHDPVTLVFGARDEIHNDAVVLRELLLRKS